MSMATTLKPLNDERTYILRFDGLVDTATNDTGLGMIIYDATNGSELWSGYRFLPMKQNVIITKNQADYMALSDGLRIIQFLTSSFGTSLLRVEIQTSNDIIFKQLNGEYRVSSKTLLPWYINVCKLIEGGDVATVKVHKEETKRAKQKATLAVKSRKSDENYKIAMQNIFLTPQNTVDYVNDDDDSSSPSHTSSADISSASESTPSRSNEQRKNTMSSNAPSISADKSYILRFDGGSRGNPGPAGSGMVLYDSEDGSEVWSGCRYLGDHFTNNEAEYTGLITGLQCARSLGIENIVAEGDSKLILQQVEGNFKVKATNLKQYHDEAMSLSKEFASFQTSHIERARNARADELANEAIDTKQNRGFNIE